jgi:hypothetical protein
VHTLPGAFKTPAAPRIDTVAENTLSLNKTLILFALVVGALIMTAIFATMPQAGRLEARERAPQSPCHTEQVSLDQGYGVSRVVERRVCDDY